MDPDKLQPLFNSHNFKALRAVGAVVAHLVYTEGVKGSNPLLPTFRLNTNG